MPNPVTEHPDPEQARRASWEAARGGAAGAIRWGLLGLAVAAACQLYSPRYRGLTVQLKVYLQLCPMVFGGYIEADGRVRQFEARMKAEKRRRIRARARRIEEGEDEEGD